MGSTVRPRRIFQVSSLAELEAFVRTWLSEVADRHILLLEGEMGAGKTQFSQLVLQHFGVEDVSSPTFNLIHSYETPSRVVHHLDLFRLESDEELESTGFWDLLREPALFLIEWGDRLADEDLKDPRWEIQRLRIEVQEDGARLLKLLDL